MSSHPSSFANDPPVHPYPAASLPCWSRGRPLIHMSRLRNGRVRDDIVDQLESEENGEAKRSLARGESEKDAEGHTLLALERTNIFVDKYIERLEFQRRIAVIVNGLGAIIFAEHVMSSRCVSFFASLQQNVITQNMPASVMKLFADYCSHSNVTRTTFGLHRLPGIQRICDRQGSVWS